MHIPLHIIPEPFFVAVEEARHQNKEHIMQAISAEMGS